MLKTAARRSLVLLALAAAMGTAFAQKTAAPAAAQNWPTKPVRILVGFPAGSTPDLVARTIAEDDAVLRRDFSQRADSVLESLAPGWDLVLWGWNFDSILQVHPLGPVSPVLMFFDQPRLRESLDEFQALDGPVQAWRLERAFGAPCYTVSPAGARKFRELCFPQKPLKVWLPGFNYSMRNVGIDVSLNAAYPQAQAWACFPPLAATPNVRGQVTAR